MAYQAKVIADSISVDGHRLTTMEVTLPRLVLAEFNTHCMFARNSASSRAIPVTKQIERIKSDPFVPIYWGANQSGMQAEQELSGQERDAAEAEWLVARDSAVLHAEQLLALGLHKQITNRLLEPFMWQTILVTASEWSNFYALRANPNAQPEIRRAAELMREAHQASTPRELLEGQWHLPLIQPDEEEWVAKNTDDAIKVSIGRCARVSYLTHDGVRDLSKDVELYERLVTSGHMSPLEHVARPFTPREWRVRHRLQELLRTFSDQQSIEGFVERQIYSSLEFNGKFHGWVQFRKTIPGESDFSKLVG